MSDLSAHATLVRLSDTQPRLLFGPMAPTTIKMTWLSAIVNSGLLSALAGWVYSKRKKKARDTESNVSEMSWAIYSSICLSMYLFLRRKGDFKPFLSSTTTVGMSSASKSPLTAHGVANCFLLWNSALDAVKLEREDSMALKMGWARL